ncbi:uncharacterized protein LOC109080447 isoform X3 [Cyprinus carpio]|uniref:Uncharacterized protein LOC109080447 isoform X3 n=1 Tax=Cyprinus carpio TaxID=7962 RepID=A0A9Q9XBJ2_CYPCA|nr:uncharacterized protein LOC109080447 isoform X3 [Cyprinus carpio]
MSLKRAVGPVISRCTRCVPCYHYNTAQNKNMEDSLRKIVSPSYQLTFNGYGQIVLGTPPQSLNDSERHTCDITQIDQVHYPSQGSGIDMTALRNVQPNRACWMHPQSSDQIKMGAPRQNWSNNCGVFVLMYTLYVVMGGILDFAESDMAAVRRWWCLLLLTNYPVKSDAERKLLRKRRKEMKTGITLTKIELEKEVEADYISKQMPLEILRHILLNVVKEDGDVAFFRLSLTCWLFHDDVCDASFRKDAHLAWLDSVVNWSAYSSDYKEMYRVPYKVTSCLCCGTYLKTSRQAILEMEGKESFVHFT